MSTTEDHLRDEIRALRMSREAFLRNIDSLLQSSGHASNAVGLVRPGGEDLALAEIKAALEMRNVAIEKLRNSLSNFNKHAYDLFTEEHLVKTVELLRVSSRLLPTSSNKTQQSEILSLTD